MERDPISWPPCPHRPTVARCRNADRPVARATRRAVLRGAYLCAPLHASVFHGFTASGITGIAQASTYEKIALGTDCNRYPRHAAKAVELPLVAGVDGPYGMALGPAAHELVLESAEHGGALLLDHLRKILGGPLVWAPGVEGAVVLSLRGGDFLFESGEDISVGYADHDAESVTLYLEESFSFRVATPEAAVALTP